MSCPRVIAGMFADLFVSERPPLMLLVVLVSGRVLRTEGSVYSVYIGRRRLLGISV